MFYRAIFMTVWVCLDHVSLLVMWTPRCSPVDENGGVLCPLFPVVHNHLLCLDHIEGEVVVLAPHGQVSDLLPIGCLVGDQALLSYACLEDEAHIIPSQKGPYS